MFCFVSWVILIISKSLATLILYALVFRLHQTFITKKKIASMVHSHSSTLCFSPISRADMQGHVGPHLVGVESAPSVVMEVSVL